MRILLGPILAFAGTALASLKVDFDSSSSIRDAAALKAEDVMSFYHGNEEGQTPGILPGPPPLGPYFWWQAGALWGTMIDYWKYTGDAQYNQVTEESLLFQVGPDRNYLEPNITASIGNDDQAFWGMSAMLAAETGFQNPPPSEPQWLSLVHAVYNTQKSHLDEETACGGGLRWQVIVMNHGYSYKNSIANGGFFNIAARLARYTEDEAYASTARSTYQWLKDIGLIDQEYNVWDGAHVENNCRDINHAQFSYSAAVILQGAAFMWDFTQDEYWKKEVDGLLHSILGDFFPSGVFFEPACEGTTNVPEGGCTQDMKSFRGFVMRWMADTAQLCPWTKDLIMAALRSSAEAAVETCTGGASGRMCGMRWGTREFDGDVNLGMEMGVLSALMTMLLFADDGEPHEDYDGFSGYSGPLDSGFATSDESAYHGGHADTGGHGIKPPLTHDTGGTSVGDPHAGQNRRKVVEALPVQEIDTIMAAVLTTLVMISGMIMFVWMGTDSLSQRENNLPPNVRQLEDLELQPLTSKAAHRYKEPLEVRKHNQRQNSPIQIKSLRIDKHVWTQSQVRPKPVQPRGSRSPSPWAHHMNPDKHARRTAKEYSRRGNRLSIETQDARTVATRVEIPGSARKQRADRADERYYGQPRNVRYGSGNLASCPVQMTEKGPEGQPQVGARR